MRSQAPLSIDSSLETSPESLTSVSSTVPAGDPEDQHISPFASPPPRNYRGEDGMWRFPNGECHPRNMSHLYDTNGRICESNPSRENFKGGDGLWHYPDRHLHPRNLYVTDGSVDYSDTESLSFLE